MSKNAKKAGKSPHGATPAIVALEKAGIAHTVHPYEHDPLSDLGYGLEAAQAIGVDAPQVFKTLMTSVDGHLVVAVVPVDRKLDLKALAHAAGAKKATLADQGDAERATGYVVGGISPLGQRKALPTVVDASAMRWNRVLCSAGKRGWEVAVHPQDLIGLTAAVVADIQA